MTNRNMIINTKRYASQIYTIIYIVVEYPNNKEPNYIMTHLSSGTCEELNAISEPGFFMENDEFDDKQIPDLTLCTEEEIFQYSLVQGFSTPTNELLAIQKKFKEKYNLIMYGETENRYIIKEGEEDGNN